MNPDTAIYLGTIAAIGLVLKTTILFNVEIKSRVAECFTIMCLFLIAQNAAEFLGYFTYLKSARVGEFFVHIYMISLIFIFPSITMLALAVTDGRYFNPLRIVLYSISVILAVCYLLGWVISGLNMVGWSVITSPGPLYWVYMGYVLLCCLGTMVYLAFCMISAEKSEIRYNARVNLLAMVPIVAVAVGVLALRVAGFDSSSAISLPIATLLFLYIMLLHTNGNLFWLTTKFKSVIAIMMMEKDASVDSIISEIEKVRIQEALKLTNGQQKLAAQILGLPASTLNKRISKYNLDANGYKESREKYSTTTSV